MLGLTGVVLSSFGTGIGDVFFYSYSTRFSTKAVGHYQSGTGLASLGSALLYAFLVDVLNCNPKYVIYSFLALPFLLLQCFMISSELHSPGQQQESNSNNKGYDLIGEQKPYTQEEQDDAKIEKVTLKQQFKALSKSEHSIGNHGRVRNQLNRESSNRVSRHKMEWEVLHVQLGCLQHWGLFGQVQFVLFQVSEASHGNSCQC
ncbi:CLN3_protein [Hexamita inflata]|uniref:CLN3 protein n=1 Tax=Hexamita inflata TaxID=28002 RepID=A0AA86UU82_9EUKA|nr:CLN3 protein [Hexamita inflata]